MKITVAKLQAYHACRWSVKKFKKLWPKGVKITLKNCRIAIAHNLDIKWLAYRMFCTKARDKFNKIQNPPWLAYQKQINNGWRLWNQYVLDHPIQFQLGLAKLSKQYDVAHTKCYPDHILVPLRKAYQEKLAIAFVEGAKVHEAQQKLRTRRQSK